MVDPKLTNIAGTDTFFANMVGLPAKWAPSRTARSSRRYCFACMVFDLDKLISFIVETIGSTIVVRPPNEIIILVCIVYI